MEFPIAAGVFAGALCLYGFEWHPIIAIIVSCLAVASYAAEVYRV